MTRSRPLLILGACAALLAACSSSDDGDSKSKTDRTTVETSAESASSGDAGTTASTPIESGAPGETVAHGPDSYQYEEVSDESGRITFEAPVDWKDRDGKIMDGPNGIMPRLAVSEDVAGFQTLQVPGVEVSLHGDVDVDGFLSNLVSGVPCTSVGQPEEAMSGDWFGQKVEAEGCGPDSFYSMFFAAVASPGQDAMAVVTAVYANETEREAALTALATFVYTPVD